MGQFHLEQLVDVVDGGATVHAVSVLAGRLDLGLLAVVLIRDLAHDLLQQVLDRDQPRRRAVLVEHDRDVHAALLHLPEQVGDLLGLRDEVRLAHDVGELRIRFPRVQMTKQILRVGNADDVVHRLPEDRYP